MTKKKEEVGFKLQEYYCGIGENLKKEVNDMTCNRQETLGKSEKLPIGCGHEFIGKAGTSPLKAMNLPSEELLVVHTAWN